MCSAGQEDSSKKEKRKGERKMKKTKWLALLLCLVMVCSLVACGSKENKNDSKTPTNTNEIGRASCRERV